MSFYGFVELSTQKKKYFFGQNLKMCSIINRDKELAIALKKELDR